VLIGQGKKLEIWDEDTWGDNQQLWLDSARADVGELPAALEELSL
jgi:DNA-binding transcriptional regulator/RsmH inhibitor MraZ